MTMDDLISRKAVLDAINELLLEPDSTQYIWSSDVLDAVRNVPASDVLDAIWNAPTVEAVPVVHGLWQQSEYNGFNCCSVCHDAYVELEWLKSKKWLYCPHCGAKMDGK